MAGDYFSADRLGPMDTGTERVWLKILSMVAGLTLSAGGLRHGVSLNLVEGAKSSLGPFPALAYLSRTDWRFII